MTSMTMKSEQRSEEISELHQRILEFTRDVDDAADARRKERVFLNVHDDGAKAGLCPCSRGLSGRAAGPQRVPVLCAVPIWALAGCSSPANGCWTYSGSGSDGTLRERASAGRILATLSSCECESSVFHRSTRCYARLPSRRSACSLPK